MSKLIPLTRGQHAIVDDEDFEWLSQFKWFCNSTRYAARFVGPYKQRSLLSMHRVITNAPIGMDVDHINGDRLDNRRCNLRVATRSQNAANRDKNTGNLSGYKGVYWNKHKDKWQVAIGYKKQTIYIGRFTDLIEAACAYDRAALQYYGEFAYLNFPELVSDITDQPAPVAI